MSDADGTSPPTTSPSYTIKPIKGVVVWSVPIDATDGYIEAETKRLYEALSDLGYGVIVTRAKLELAIER